MLSDRTLRRLGTVALVLVPLVAGWNELISDRQLIKDEVRHFAYLHSLLLDRDLDFTNELAATWPKFAERPWFVEATDLPPNEAAIGPALAWAPAYLLIHLVLLLAAGLGAPVEASGFGPPYYAAAVVVSSLAFSLGIYLAYRLARDRLGVRRAGLAASTVAAGTHYVYWWLYPGLYGHALAVGATALFVWYWIESWGRLEMRRWVWLGVLGGLVALVRWQNVWLPAMAVGLELLMLVAGTAPAPPAPASASPASSSASPASSSASPAFSSAPSGSNAAERAWRLVPRGAAFGVAMLVASLPQLAAWKVVYDSWLVVPQGEQLLQLDKPYFVDLLFSPRYGLLGFSPLLYLPVIGLVAGALRRRWQPLLVLGALYLAVVIYLNASLTGGSWYGGATFGPRRLDSLFVFFVLGCGLAVDALCRWIERRPQAVVAGVTGVATFYMLLLAGGYRSGAINFGMEGAERFPADASQLILREVGWLPSLPAEIYFASRGMRWGQYTRLAHADPLVRGDGVIELGAAATQYLDGNWRLEDRAAEMVGERAGLFVYLMDLGWLYKDIEIGISFDNAAAERLDLVVNGVPVGGQLRHDADGSWQVWATAPYRILRPGINQIDVVAGTPLPEARFHTLQLLPVDASLAVDR